MYGTSGMQIPWALKKLTPGRSGLKLIFAYKIVAIDHMTANAKEFSMFKFNKARRI